MAIKVEITQTDNGYALMRGGEPYTVRGAGMAYDDIERFAARGGNSIRNWSTVEEGQDTQALLDAAHANDVSVMLCLSMKPERYGFDYDDPKKVADQLETMRQEVIKYRDHPALLGWIIGNELNLEYENPAVWNAVNDVALMIREVDGKHPTTTALAGWHDHVITDILERATALDFLSFQEYGSLFGLPEKMRAYGFDKPFMVTEWGTIGYWEMENTDWGIPVEMTSSEKADTYARGQSEILDGFGDQLIGSYAFLWGQKQERTPTWFGMFTEEGERTEVIDILERQWTGDWPANRTPRVDSLLLDEKGSRQSVTLQAGQSYAAVFDVTDPDGDTLTYRWEVKSESDATVTGGDFEESIPNVEGALSATASAETTLNIGEPGKYRVFAYAYDGQGNAAHANIPFLVVSDASADAIE